MHLQKASPSRRREHICKCTAGKPACFPKAPVPTGLVALWWISLFPSNEESLPCPCGLAAPPCLQGIALDQAKSTCSPKEPGGDSNQA